MREKRRAGLFFALSLAAHLSLLSGPTIINSVIQRWNRIEPWGEQITKTVQWNNAEIQRRREKLVSGSLTKMRNNTFRLGEFILEANMLDSLEKGEKRDFNRAKEVYHGLLSELERNNQAVQNAMPEILDSFEYSAAPTSHIPDMTQMLLKGYGKCDQISELITSLVHDIGYGNDIRLRTYHSHVAPIFVENGESYDLATGTYAECGGKSFLARELVYIYAHQHNIETPEVTVIKHARCETEELKKDNRIPLNTGTFRYPQSDDPFPALVPLWRSKAVGEFSPRNIGKEIKASAQYPIRLDILNLIPLNKARDIDIYSVSPVDVIPDGYLDALMNDIERMYLYEKSRSEIAQNNEIIAERILSLGYLSGLQKVASVQLKFFNRYEHARYVDTEREKTIKKAIGLFGQLTNQDPDIFLNVVQNAKQDSSAPRFMTWHLAFLGEQGEETLLTMARNSAESSIFSISGYDINLALFIMPHTRQRIAAILEQKSLLDKAIFLYFLSNNHIEIRQDDNGNVSRRHRCIIESSDDETYNAYKVYSNIFYMYPPLQRTIVSETTLGTEPPEFSKLRELAYLQSDAYGLEESWKRTVIISHAIASIVYLDSYHGNTFDITSSDERRAALKFTKEFDDWLAEVDTDNDPSIKKLREYTRFILSHNRFDQEILMSGRTIFR
ncbi:hypothetical protein KKF81_06350 [Candidatus Micrarchaeota archaeon]|nr:hypothetical protein [Candidatus Micrarchaeota archaeon]